MTHNIKNPAIAIQKVQVRLELNIGEEDISRMVTMPNAIQIIDRKAKIAITIPIL
jgi:hypothetical protein